MKSILNMAADLKKFALRENLEEAVTEEISLRLSPELRILIVHAESNESWATRIEMDLDQSLPHVLDGVRYSCARVEISGNFAEIEEQLLNHLDLDYHLDAAHYPFIVTTGEWESDIVNTVREVSGIKVPQLFCMQNVPKSVQTPIATRRTNNSLSGVFTRPTDPKEFLHLIRGALPYTETVCLLIGERDEYGQNGEKYTEEQAAVANCFRRAGSKVLFHYWSESDPRTVELQKKADQSNVFILFSEPASTINMPVLRGIAREYQVLIAASDLDAVLEGAAIGAGVSGAAFSAPLMSLILDVVLCRRNRLSPPICIPQQPVMRYCYRNMREQGLELTDEQYAMLRARTIEGSDDTKY